jgi:hypothetical protein
MNEALDRSTDTVAAAAVVSPFWLPILQDVSGIAALIVPILGAIWLVVQIVGYFRRKDK